MERHSLWITGPMGIRLGRFPLENVLGFSQQQTGVAAFTVKGFGSTLHHYTTGSVERILLELNRLGEHEPLFLEIKPGIYVRPDAVRGVPGSVCVRLSSGLKIPTDIARRPGTMRLPYR